MPQNIKLFERKNGGTFRKYYHSFQIAKAPSWGGSNVKASNEALALATKDIDGTAVENKTTFMAQEKMWAVFQIDISIPKLGALWSIGFLLKNETFGGYFFLGSLTWETSQI